jgi:precorrin isomerase
MDSVINLLSEAKNTVSREERTRLLKQAKIIFDALMITEGIANPSGNKNILHG